MSNTREIENRVARCAYCRTERPSKEWERLAFFEYRGPGSDDARNRCKHCGYFAQAHQPEVMARNRALKCTNFAAEPKGSEFDLYYCGCRGWD